MHLQTARICFCYAVLFVPCISRLCLSFQGQILSLGTRRAYLVRNLNQNAASSSSNEDCDGGNSIFNDKSIIGETLDVALHDGTYTWSNTKTRRRDYIRPDDQSSTSSQELNKERYKRIPFDGCGSILLHQEPESFVAPNSAADNNGKSLHRRRQKGRTGVTLWSASYVISNYIDAQWSKGGSWYDADTRASESKSTTWTVLELGAGLGLCSAVAAKNGMNVVSTDNDPDVISLLKDNLERNTIYNNHQGQFETRSTTSTAQQEVHVHSLDWVDVAKDPDAEYTHPVFMQLETLGGADLILLSDVIYGATQPAWDALLVLLNKFCAQRQRLELEREEVLSQSDQKKRPIILLGYTQRRRDMSPHDEACFFAMVKAAGMEAVLIPSTSIPNSEKYMLTSLFELRQNR